MCSWRAGSPTASYWSESTPIAHKKVSSVDCSTAASNRPRPEPPAGVEDHIRPLAVERQSGLLALDRVVEPGEVGHLGQVHRGQDRDVGVGCRRPGLETGLELEDERSLDAPDEPDGARGALQRRGDTHQERALLLGEEHAPDVWHLHHGEGVVLRAVVGDGEQRVRELGAYPPHVLGEREAVGDDQLHAGLRQKTKVLLTVLATGIGRQFLAGDAVRPRWHCPRRGPPGR